jgi:hypothetical protein
MKSEIDDLYAAIGLLEAKIFEEPEQAVFFARRLRSSDIELGVSKRSHGFWEEWRRDGEALYYKIVGKIRKRICENGKPKANSELSAEIVIAIVGAALESHGIDSKIACVVSSVVAKIGLEEFCSE